MRFNIRKNRKVQFIVLLILVCLVATMSIAYAVLSTTLNINGTAQVIDASWDVHFDNVQVNPNSVPITPKITDNDKITFSADLTTPGEFYKFTVDIINDGSIDAMIESVIKNPELTSEQKKYLRYEVEYVDGTSINETQLLKLGETKTISVLVSYRNDIPVSDLPKIETNLDLEIRFVYVQATSLGTEVSGNEKLVKVISGNYNTVGSEISIGNEHFYVISSSKDTVTMLAKYNLYVGSYCANLNTSSCTVFGDKETGLQDSRMIGWVDGVDERFGVLAFSSTNYWINTTSNYPAYVYDSNSYLYTPVQNYKNYLEKLGVSVKSARLINADELVNLGCSLEQSSCSNSKYDWIYLTSYWTGMAANQNIILVVTTTDSFYSNHSYQYSVSRGVRPVIEIPVSEF